MRTKILLLFLLGWVGMVFSQKDSANSRKYVDSTQHIIYNFKLGDYSKDIHKIKVHTPVIFKIKNINPFAYKITITSKDSIVGESKFDKELINSLTQKELQKAEEKLSQEQAEANKNLSKQTEVITDNDLKGETAEKKKNSQAISAINQNRILNDENLKLKADNAEILNLLKVEVLSKDKDTNVVNDSIIAKKKMYAKSYPDSVKVVTNLQSTYNKIKERIIENSEKIKENKALINEKTKEYQILSSDFNEKYKKFIDDCRYVFSLLRITKKVSAIAEIPDLDTARYIKDYQKEVILNSRELFLGISQMDEYKKSYSELNESYVKLYTMNNLDLIMEKSGIDKLLSFPKFQKEKADQLNLWFSKYHSDEIIKQAFLVTTQLDNLENYTIKSDPFQPENDMIEFKINIEPRDKTNIDKNYKPRNFVYRQAIYGGTRVDFSLGLAAAYYGKVSRYEIGLENQLKTYEKKLVSSSLIGMVTMSYRRTGYTSFGGSAGMGLDVVGGKIQISNFFIGPTILMGKKDRIFFTLGASLKNVRELKDGYEGLKVPVADDLTSYSRDKYRVGVFASLTYSLTKDARALIKSLR